MKIKKQISFEIRAYIKGPDGLNVSVSQIYSDFLKEEKVTQLSPPPYSPDLCPCDFFLFPLLKKTLSGHCYESQKSLGSAIYQCLQGIPKKAYFSALTEWILRHEKYFHQGRLLQRP